MTTKLSNVQEKTSPIFFKPAQGIDQTQTTGSSFWGGAADRVATLYHGIKDSLFRVSDTKILERVGRELDGKVNKYINTFKAPALSIPPTYFRTVLKRRFEYLFRASALQYFTQKIATKTLSYEDFAGPLGSVLIEKKPNLERLIAKMPFHQLVALIPEDDRKKMMDPKSHPWGAFFDVVKSYFSFVCLQKQEHNVQQFLSLFTEQELSAPGSWKICLGQRLVAVKEEEMPSFLHERFRQVTAGLPQNYDGRVAQWQRKQKEALTGLEKECRSFHQLFSKAFAMEDVLCSANRLQSLEHLLEDAGTTISCKYAEKFTTFPDVEDVEEGIRPFMASMMEVSMVHTLWKERGKITEAQFRKAYDNWDRISKDFDQLKRLLAAEQRVH